MKNSKLKEATALLNQADSELTKSFENDGMDEYDYEDAVVLASELIRKALKIIIDIND